MLDEPPCKSDTQNRVIEGIRALAKERGDTRVLWTTTEGNVGPQRFHDRLGMRREKKVYYVMDV